MAKTIATIDSSMVAGRNCPRSRATGRRVLMEIPKSPIRTPRRNVRYCWWSGRSRPHLARNAATISGRWEACWPRFATIGSAGAAWEITKVITVKPTTATAASSSRRAT